jgi:hypothetical protein
VTTRRHHRGLGLLGVEPVQAAVVLAEHLPLRRLRQLRVAVALNEVVGHLEAHERLGSPIVRMTGLQCSHHATARALAPSKELLTPRSARKISPTNRGLLPGAPVPTGTGLTPAGLTQLSGRNMRSTVATRRPQLRRPSVADRLPDRASWAGGHTAHPCRVPRGQRRTGGVR